MSALIWQDISTYSRGDTVRKPTTWQTHAGFLRIVVTSGHIHYPGRWVMHCHKLGIDSDPFPESVTTAEQAQRAAVKAVQKITHEITTTFRPVESQPGKSYQAEIDATHPMEDGATDATVAADTLAMKLVGERHDKRDIVDLVRWLILRKPDGLI